MTSETRTCRNCEESFAIETEDVSFYEKTGMPPPTFCPACRLQRRLLFRNERTLYRRNCDLCSRSMVSMYPVDSPLKVYCVKCWWSDKWDPYEYGREIDPAKPFFAQFRELLFAVPVLAMSNDDGVASLNSEYASDFAFSKNCYMTTAGWHSENVMYSYYTCYDKDIMDCWLVNNSELMCQVMHGEKSYGCSYSMYLADCRNCMLSFNLKNCSDCFMCVGLRGKSYCIRNEQYSREEYLAKLQGLALGSYARMQELRREFWEYALRFPRKYASSLKTVNSTGHGLMNCKNSRQSFYSNDLEDSKFMLMIDGAKACYDCTNSGRPNFCYECLTPDNSYDCRMTIFCWKCNHVEYSHWCPSSENLFGCTGLKKGSYAILNRRYAKEEYEKLRGELVQRMQAAGEWGEFFPKELSPFAYNEVASQEWLPLDREQALAKGYRWRGAEERNYKITLTPEQLPDSISDVSDDILEQVIGCAHAGTCNEKCASAFRIVAPELQMYRKLSIPLPRLCPNCRHYERLKRVDPLRLVHRRCMCLGVKSDLGNAREAYTNTREHFHGAGACPNEFESPYTKERLEIVYCEECYHGEVA